MADPVTLQDIYDLFKASQADLQASAAEFDQRMAESKAEFDRRMAESKAEADHRMELEQLAANASREVSRLGDRWGLLWKT
jgi:Ser/Thr protein kinase RdoA (MazF antagonist)